MKEIEINKKAWSRLAEVHYRAFEKLLRKERSLINPVIMSEIGNISGKSIIHLQCNTGADTISLARQGATVTGIDLVPENIRYARKLADSLEIENVRFIESDIMNLMENHNDRYDVVFTTEGAVGWLPDLGKWAATIRHLLRDDGYFYVMDIHPFMLVFDEELFMKNELRIGYPYFKKSPDLFDRIGGYASGPVQADNYSWMYTVGDLINSLSEAGLCIDFFHEFDKLFFNLGNLQPAGRGFYRNPFFRGKLPLTFSILAHVKK